MWLTEIFRHWIAPHCALCAKHIGDPLVCPACISTLPYNDHACRCCAEPLPDSVQAPALCAQCLKRKPAFEQVLAPLIYGPPIDSVIHALKFQRHLGAAHTLAELLDHALPDISAPDVVIPVPLHASRIRQRGFNQALEIAKPLCQLRQWPLAVSAATRILPTPPQRDLSARERRKNLRGAFVIDESVVGQQVLILDDVLTTGSTASALADVLKKAGAASVRVLVVARTPPTSMPHK